jgi:Cys-tRNA(Pro)/Cys-tRNA(Cys) deacylase
VTAAATHALEVVTRAGVPHRVHPYALPEHHRRARDARPNYGIEAAAALGIEPARVFKTLVAFIDDRLVLAVVPVDRELDLKRLAAATGGRRAVMADPAEAERATGYVIGGISPLGSRRQLAVVVEGSAFDHDTVFVSAGRRGLQLEMAPHDLVRLCHGTSAQIARDADAG